MCKIMKHSISNWGNKICPKSLASFPNVLNTLEHSVEQMLFDNIPLLIQKNKKR